MTTATDFEDLAERQPRVLAGVPRHATSVIAVAFAGFQVYTAWAGAFPDLIQRGVHFAFALALTFVLFPAGRARSARPSLVDLGLAAAGVAGSAYVVVNYERLTLQPGESTTLDLVLGGLMVLLVLEAARRTIGPIMPAMALVTILYAWSGPYLPGPWRHRGFSLRYVLETLYLSSEGIWGLILGLSATVVAAFLIFGAFLTATGGGDVFVGFAQWLAGRSHGGPAKVSCVSSALFGTVSGSAVANVVVDGVFNIPLMKRLKYEPSFAAAVEAVTSTGGQLVPPVMGAGAFIMAELIGVPYVRIAAAAIIPSVLYYLGIGAAIHFEALRAHLRPLPADMIPTLRSILPRSAPFVVPVGIVVIAILQGYTPDLAVMWAVAASAIVHLAGARHVAGFRARGRVLVEALDAGGRAIPTVAALCACAQIIISMFNLSGLGVKISALVLSVSGGHLFLALVMTMIVCLILGMGVPTTAAYVLAASVTGPALVGLGFPPLVAHLFIFYFAIISAITLPVAPAVFVAAAIAKTSIPRTGVQALRIGFACFIVPYMFVYGPSVLLIGDVVDIVTTTASASVGVVAIAAGLMRYFRTHNTWWESAVLIVGGLLLVKPGLFTDLVGVAAVAAVWVVQGHRAVSVAAVPEQAS